MKKYMPLEGLRWSRDSGSTLCDTPQNGRSRTGWGKKEADQRRLLLENRADSHCEGTCCGPVGLCVRDF